MPPLLQLSPDLSLPVDVVTETIAIIAKRRSGKSYTARKLIEQLLATGLQVVVVDPKGDHWGLRSSADGKQPGYPILIVGGEHGDIWDSMLDVHGGEVLARFVVEQRANLLLDLSGFRKHEVATFMTGFLETLYRLKAREEFRTPMMLAIDEADAIAPQRPQKGEERMLGAAEDIVRRGGQRGIGCTLISQRSAVLNKNTLTQAQVLIALRTMSPQDLAALDSWIEVHGTPAERRVLFESLPSLPVGDAWVWSPGWPTVDGIFQRIHVAPIETFDSGATPKVGQKITPPKSVAEVDLSALKDSLAATIEKAKADDPRELRKRIGQLERELRERGHDAQAPIRVEVPVIERALVKEIAEAVEGYASVADNLIQQGSRLVESAEQLRAMLSPWCTEIDRHGAAGVIELPRQPRAPEPAHRSREPLPPVSIEPRVSPNGEAKLGRGERKVLAVLAQYPDGRTSRELAFLAGYSAKASTLGVILSKLRKLGYVTPGGDPQLTKAGLGAIGPVEALPTGPELLEYWYRHPRMGGGERKVLDALIANYPDDLDHEYLCELTGYSPNASTLGVIMSKLRKLGLVEPSARRVSPEFMDAIRSTA